MATPSATPVAAAKNVIVNIQVDPSREIRVDLDPVILNRLNGDTVTWECRTGEHFEISFFETPFHSHNFDRITGRHVAPRQDAEGRGKHYKYTIHVQGCPPCDPDVLIQP